MAAETLETFQKLDWKHEPESVRGKRVLLPGGTTGIGRATALLIVSEGAKVITYGEREDELSDALEDIRKVAANGGEIAGFVADQSKPEGIQRVFQEVDRLGGLDILINNAATPAQDVLQQDYQSFEWVIRTNLLGYMACAREAVNRFEKSGKGHIVCIGSMSADVKDTGADIYVATKTGISGFCDSLRKEVNEKNIKVTLIEPGLVGTSLHVDEKAEPEKQRQMQANDEMLTAEDLAACVYYTITQPWRTEVVNIEIKPTRQII